MPETLSNRKINIKFIGGNNDELLNVDLNIKYDDYKQIKNFKEFFKFMSESFNDSRNEYFEKDGSLVNGTLCLLDDVNYDIIDKISLDDVSQIDFITSLHGG